MPLNSTMLLASTTTLPCGSTASAGRRAGLARRLRNGLAPNEWMRGAVTRVRVGN